MTEFRALCAEGVAFIRSATDPDDLSINAHEWAEKVNAALAEPEAPINWAAYFVRQAVVQEQELKAALAEPEPEGPTLDEIDDLCAEHSFCYEDSESLECLLLIITDALARWGRPAPQPVPVSERWPEFSDCDNAERVWCWNWRVGAWRLSRIDLGIHSHWLPAHALLVPSHD